MSKYRKILFYKKASINVQSQYLPVSLILSYAIRAYLSITLSVLYNILGTDARSLWEPKVPGQALWETLDRSDPGATPTVPVEVVVDSLQLESGAAFETEAGNPLELE